VAISTEERDQLLAGEQRGQRIQANDEGRPVLQARPQASLNQRCQQACDAIDRTAGVVRKSLVSAGHAIEEEYRIAYEAARTYLEDVKHNPPKNTPPASIIVQAEIAGLSPQAAAEIICAKHDQWRALLEDIRDRRLRGKAAIKQTAQETPDADLMAIAQTFMDQLTALTTTTEP